MRTARVGLWVVPFALVLGLAAEACGQERTTPPRHVPGPPDRQPGMVEHWTERLANEIEHLYEDLYYDRAGGGLLRDAERALEAVMHFQQVLQRGADREHLLRDFRDMDRELHQLLDRLAGSRAPWIRRSGSRVQYADEQLHYYLRVHNRRDDEASRELVARHAHLLEQEARQLEQLQRNSDRSAKGRLSTTQSRLSQMRPSTFTKSSSVEPTGHTSRKTSREWTARGTRPLIGSTDHRSGSGCVDRPSA